MHKIITLSDANYFDTGQLFLKTKKRVNADFVLYGPDLTNAQIEILNDHNVEYIKIGETLFREEMQFLKFQFMIQQIERDTGCKYSGFTLADFDTFFINDWEKIFDYNFDYGITIRYEMIKRKTLRGYANGGVVFAKHSAIDILQYAKNVIVAGEETTLPEYDFIWKTLENGRPPHRTHYRTVLRWWVDQVFLSSLALRYFSHNDYKNTNMPKFFYFNAGNAKIGLFNCEQYNKINSKPSIKIERGIYIRHLKQKGRKALIGEDRTIEKL